MNANKINLQLVKSLVNNIVPELIDLAKQEIIKLKQKRLWVRNWIARKNIYGGSKLIRELRTEDPAEFQSTLRMTTENFGALLNLVSDMITKSDTIMRQALPVRLKLEITLTYLTTGSSTVFLEIFYRVSKSAISKFIPEVCDAIYEKLKDNLQVRK
ncbi:hypothetical protein NQ314_010588 [Rhamnusium bicolor]|uniref:Uncharacterized protein n=1 Tax=Rhamnusium bicolor TaxID=1586634 RepID=A0AAV8XQM1_9CUCU|nr:hypothetical protein NQ314_010588 [Rhamnusium bicolor]